MADIIFSLVLAVSSWAAPQPVYSEGLLVIYGNQHLVQANADWRGYDLSPYAGRCGLSAISPAMLGRIAWVRVDGSHWAGPCVVVDAVARIHAYDSIYQRQEVAEISRATAAALGFTNGGQWGYVFFGACPPNADSVWHQPQPYAPPLRFDYGPLDHTPSFYPYPPQQMPVGCH